MNRLGLSPAEARDIAARPELLAAFAPTMVMTHLACADEPAHPENERQRAAFAAVRDLFPGLPGSLASSAGIRLGPAYRHDHTRPGIALYGGSPMADGGGAMRVVARHEAPVLALRDVAA